MGFGFQLRTTITGDVIVSSGEITIRKRWPSRETGIPPLALEWPKAARRSSLARSGLRVQGFAAFKLRKSFDRFPRFLLSDPQVVKALQIQPKLGARAEEVGEA